MTAMTGLRELVVAFDFDGVLTSSGVANSRADVDLTPLRIALDAGCRVAVMTCNHVGHVADVLECRGVPVRPDWIMYHRLPPDRGRVLVTNRKVVADLYVDDHGFRWKFGDDLGELTRMMAGLALAG